MCIKSVRLESVNLNTCCVVLIRVDISDYDKLGVKEDNYLVHNRRYDNTKSAIQVIQRTLHLQTALQGVVGELL